MHIRRKPWLRVFPSVAACSALFLYMEQPPASAAAWPMQKKTIQLNQQTFSMPYGTVYQNTTYMPIWYVMQVLTRLGIQNTWDGHEWTITSPSYMPVDLGHVTAGKSGKSIVLNGITMYRVNSLALTDPASHQLTTFMPIWYVQQLLNRFAIGSTWNGRTWALTSPPPPTVTVANSNAYPTLRTGNNGYPVVLLQQKLNAAGYSVGNIDAEFGLATVNAVEAFQASAGLTPDGVVGPATWSALNERLAAMFTQPTVTTTGQGKIVATWAVNYSSTQDAMAQNSINHISNDDYEMNADGSVTSGSSAVYSLGLLESRIQSGQGVFATVTNIGGSGNFDGTMASQVLSTTSSRQQLENQLVQLSQSNGYAGIDLDIEMLHPTDRANFSQFVTELSGALHQAGKQLSVCVPAETGPVSEPWDDAYDYTVLGSQADYVNVMAYDFSWAASSPGAIAPLWWDQQVLTYATSVMPSNKILLGLAAYGYDWSSGTSYAVSRTLTSIDSLIQQYQINTNWDSTDAVPYFSYTDSAGNTHTVYYENEASISQKLNLVDTFHLGGISFWRAGEEDAGFRSAVDTWASVK